jgi:protein transport protein SEC13
LFLGLNGSQKNSHNSPVWQVAWAHPKYGHILASCSFDGKVLIWKEQQGGSAVGGWIKIKEHTLHTASGNPEFVVFFSMGRKLIIHFFSLPVNSVAWAPHELGAILACASSDGKVSVLTFKS